MVISRPCRDCGKFMRNVHPNRKICDECKQRLNRERSTAHHRAKMRVKYPSKVFCECCGKEFKPLARADTRFCYDESCKKERARRRWVSWRRRREEEGTFRDTVNAYQQEFRQRTGYARDWELKKRYGISLPDWIAMVEAVGGKCEICGKAEEDLCVDHDHSTGIIRGVLCRRCNRALGQLGDTVERLSQVLAYLERTLTSNEVVQHENI